MELNKVIAGCIAQKISAQETLYNTYKEVLFGLSLKYCRNEAEAEDNLHNAFITIFGKIHEYKGAGSFEGWMKRITINMAISSYKKQYQLVPIHDEFQDTEVEESEVQHTVDELIALVQALPNQYRLVFCLYELDDYSHKEIAGLLDISESTSKSNLHRAKHILKEKIQKKNFHNNSQFSNGK